MITEDMIARDPNYIEAKVHIKNKRCLRHPDKMLAVGMKDGQYSPHCAECYPEPPVLGEAPGTVLERSGQMATRSLATRQDRLATLAVQDVQALIPGLDKCTEQEVKGFILYCKAVDADPWAKEIYLIKYDRASPAAIALALNWYLKRASHNPLYESYQSGIVVERQGQYVDVVGSTLYPGDKLFGGWCKVFKKGAAHPFERRVSMTEYDKGQAGWTKMPATMIEKVAIVQAVRRAFPDEFAAEPEVGLPVLYEGDVEAEVTELPQAPVPAAMPAVAETAICPIDGATMRRNRWKKWSHDTGEGNGKGKSIWHNFTDQELEQAQEVPQEPQTEASEPEQAPQGTPPAETYTFEQKRKMLFDWAESKYGLAPDQVAAAAGITLDQITEATDLRWVTKQVEALYGG